MIIVWPLFLPSFKRTFKNTKWQKMEPICDLLQQKVPISGYACVWFTNIINFTYTPEIPEPAPSWSRPAWGSILRSSFSCIKYRGSSSVCITCMYCCMSVKMVISVKHSVACEDPERICIAFAFACVISKKSSKMPKLSSMVVDNAITRGGIGSLVSLV